MAPRHDAPTSSDADAERRWTWWQMASDAERLVVAERQPSIAHVLAMIAINRQSNRCCPDCPRDSVRLLKADDARTLLGQALAATDEIRKAESAAEYGPWKNWYAGDWLTNVGRTRQAIQLYAQRLDDPLSPMPSALLWDWEAYYHILHYEGERVVDVK
jgi:hypothetical protein